MTSLHKLELQVEPYSKLAYIYDEIMSHVDYKNWVEYIYRIINNWHPNAKYIIDIACGTGNFLFRFNYNDYELFGFDRSIEAIQIAKKKFSSNQREIALWQSNIKKFALKNPTDIILCLYDSINYLTNFEEVKNTFDCVHTGLKENGLFIFDICTERNSVTFFKNYFEKNKGKNYRYIRTSNYDNKTHIHSNIFKLDFNDSDFIYVERHEQRIYRIEDILTIIPKSKFCTICVLDEFTFKRATEKSFRAHFILKKV